MFMGETVCIFVHLIRKWKIIKEYGKYEDAPDSIEAKSNGLKLDYHPIICSIPMFIDCFASLCLMISYVNIPASIVQMINSLVIIVVSLESQFLLGQKQYKHHWVGSVLAIIGTIIVATAVFLSERDSVTGNILIGVIAILISVVAQATHAISEEYLMRKYYIHPFQFAGWEGIWVLPILNSIPCKLELCSYGYVENSIFAIQQIFNSSYLLILLLGWIIILSFYNGLGISVTSLVSASNRIISTRLKIVFIWVFFLVYPYEGHERFKPLQLIGFILLSIGVLIYNEIIIINLWGLSDNLTIHNEKETKDDHYVEFKDETLENA